jgi:hypothetical protein
MELCGTMRFCHNCGTPNNQQPMQPVQGQYQDPHHQQNTYGQMAGHHGQNPDQPHNQYGQPHPQQPVQQTVVYGGPFPGVVVSTTAQPGYQQQPVFQQQPFVQQQQGDLIPCAFCGGEGEDPFNFSNPCRVCQGKGKNMVYAPMTKCARCEGQGHEPFNLNQVCQTCGGKGFVTVR